MEIFALLIVAHALADYPLQGDFLAKAKNHTEPIPGVPWYQALIAHSAIHAGFVGVITGSIWLGLAEFIVHNLTDYAKCAGRISYNTDQAIHVGCKAVWTMIAISFI
mgnify:CR=1 FL=1